MTGSERREVDNAIEADSLRGNHSNHWRELRLCVIESLLLRGLLLAASAQRGFAAPPAGRARCLVYYQRKNVSHLKPSIEELSRHKHC